MVAVLRALKEAVEQLGGTRGPGLATARAVTVDDLVRLGVVTGTAFASPTGQAATGTRDQPYGFPGLDGNGQLPWVRLRPEAQRLPLGFVMPGRPPAGATMNLVMVMDLSLPASLAGALAYAGAAPNAPAVFALNKLSGEATTVVGSVTLTGPGHAPPALYAPVPVSLAPGDVLQLVAPSPQDPLLADVGITLLASKV